LTLASCLIKRKNRKKAGIENEKQSDAIKNTKGYIGVKLPAHRDCVAIAGKGERQSGSKALGCGAFRLCEIVHLYEIECFHTLARLISNS